MLGAVVNAVLPPQRRLWPRRSPAVWLGAEGRGTPDAVLAVAPTRQAIADWTARWPRAQFLVAEPLDAPEGAYGDRVQILPRIVPAPFYPLSSEADVFGVSMRLHLHERPRVSVITRWPDGRSVTLMFQTIQALRHHVSEWVLLGGLAVRDQLAPVVQQLHLEQTVIFAPEVTVTEFAGLLSGSDAVLHIDVHAHEAAWLSDALASGCPIVSVFSDACQAVLGPGALWVYQWDAELVAQALRTALNDGAVREELAQRALRLAEPWHAARSTPIWTEALTQFRDQRVPQGPARR